MIYTVEIFRFDLYRRKDQDERECKILWREENMDHRFSIHELIHKNWNVWLKRSDTINRRSTDSLLFQGTRSSCLTFLVWYEREKKHNVFRVIQPRTWLVRTARLDESSSRWLKLKFYEGYDRNHWQVNRINQCYTSWPLQRSTKQAGPPKMTERSTRIVKRISRSVGFEHEVGDTRLHISSSQKHMRPVPVLSIMHTWSTMNKFICSCEVQVRLTLSYATNRRKKYE